MKRKFIPYSLLGALLAVGAGHYANAFVATGPDDELFATGTAGAQENDNIFLTHSDAKSDEVFDLTPGLEWDFGKNAQNQGYLSVGNDFQLYGSDTKLDTDLPMAALVSAYNDGKTKVNVNANYAKLDQATRDVHLVGTLVKRDWYHVDGTAEVAITDKTSVSAGVIYDNTQYSTTGYESWEWVNVPLKYYYAVEPKLDLSAGFSYQNNTIGAPGLDSDEYFYNVGARGEFTPKLSGQFSVGFEQIQFKHGGTTNGVGADSQFNFAYTPKTTFTLSILNNFGYSPAGGASYRDLGISGGMVTVLSDQWKAGGQISYNKYNYISTTEKDNFYAGQVYATYIYNAYLSFTGAYRYAEDSSNITADSFTNNIFSIAATVKY